MLGQNQKARCGHRPASGAASLAEADVLTFAKPKPRQRFEKIEQTTVGCRLRSAAMIGAAQARNFPLGRILLQLFKAHLRRLIRQRVSSVGRILPSYAQRCT